MQPPSSDTPLIGIYFSSIMMMVACSVVCTILILNYHKRAAHTHALPGWVETVFLRWLPWLLRMETPGPRLALQDLLLAGVDWPARPVPRQEDFIAGGLANSNFPLAGPARSPADSERSLPSLAPLHRPIHAPLPPSSPLERDLQEIHKEILVISSKIREDDEADDTAAKWKLAAMVMDRLCLVVFILFTTILSLVVFSVSPNAVIVR